MSELLLIPPTAFEAVIPDVLSHLDEIAALTGGRNSRDGLVAKITSGEMQLWVTYAQSQPEAVMLTENRHYEGGRALNILGIVGTNMAGWIDLMDDLIEWAERHDYQWIEGSARRGFARALAPKGFSSERVEIERRLDG